MKQKKYFAMTMAVLLLTLCSLENSAFAERHQLYIGYKLPENTDLIYEARRLEANAFSQRNIEIQACANGNDATRCEQQAEIAFRRRISAIPGAYFILNYKINGEILTYKLMNLTASEAADINLNQTFNHLQPDVVFLMGIDMETSDCQLLSSDGGNNPIFYHKQDFPKLVCQLIEQNMNATTLLWHLVHGYKWQRNEDKKDPLTLFVKIEIEWQLSEEVDTTFLLNHGADPNFKNDYDIDLPMAPSILMLASEKNYASVAKLLITHGADIDSKDMNGETALNYAALSGSVEVAKLLIENHANVNNKNNVGVAPLELSVNNGHLGVVKLLVENGADVNQKDSEGNTALSHAAMYGSVEIAKLLIENHTNVNDKNMDISTALNYAALSGSVEVAKLLIENHAEVNSKNTDGYTALNYAALSGSVEVAKLLIENHANVNDTNSLGWAASSGGLLLDMIKLSNGGTVPLWWTASSDYLGVVKLLVENGAEINNANGGFTVLMAAASQGNRDIVEFLLQKGADINQKNDEGYTALYFAREHDHVSLAEFLRLHGGVE